MGESSYLEQLFSLRGQVALVTGAARGIGQTVAFGLARAGAEVCALDRLDAGATVKSIQDAGGRAFSLTADVTDEAQVEAAATEVIRRTGRIDIVFNNAGIGPHKAATEMSAAEWRQVVDVNLTGVFLVARATGRLMIERGIRGSIINMASMSATIVNVPQLQAAYNASKAGVRHLSKTLAVEWAPYGIRVNSLSPGYIATPMVVGISPEMKQAWESRIPLRRMGTPEELVGAVIYLASGAASYTSGHDLVADGGYTCL